MAAMILGYTAIHVQNTAKLIINFIYEVTPSVGRCTICEGTWKDCDTSSKQSPAAETTCLAVVVKPATC